MKPAQTSPEVIARQAATETARSISARNYGRLRRKPRASARGGYQRSSWSYPTNLDATRRLLVNRHPTLALLKTGAVASRATHPTLPDRLSRPRLIRDRLVGLEPMVGRLSTGLTVEFLRRRYRRHLALNRSFASGFGQCNRWNQPHRIVGVIEDPSETQRVADAVPPLVVEPCRGLLLALQRFLPVPPSPVTGGIEQPLSLF